MHWDHQVNLDQNYNFIPSGEKESFSQQCTLFASSVLHYGGVKDTRDDPVAAGGTKDLDPAYWDIEVLMEGAWEWRGYSSESSWYRTDPFYKFVTSVVGRRVLRYNNPPHNNEILRYGRNAPVDKSWEKLLLAHRGLIQEGDLVFYGDGIKWDHVAVVVGWGFPTSFSVKEDTDVSASGIEPDSEMLRWIKSLQCRGDFYMLAFPLMPVRPLVVERSGSINYASWRSLDNTGTASPVIDIVHINDH